MDDDIVKRLHGEHYCDQCEDDFLPNDEGSGVLSPGLHSLAALEIERLRAESESWRTAREDLAAANSRLQRELGDARQSIIDLQGANAAYVKANGRLHSELRAAKLLREGLSNMVDKAQEWFDALEVAHSHLDMAALRVSHPKDAATIEAALPPPAPAPEDDRHEFIRDVGTLPHLPGNLCVQCGLPEDFAIHRPASQPPAGDSNA